VTVTDTTDKGAARRQEARERLQRELEKLTQSDEWRRWLDCRAAFHTYSFHNTLLIVSQKPHATRCAGFKTWKKLERNVRKGETAIWIWAPMVVKDRDAADPDARRMIFRPVPVFDVSQTDGEPLPELEREPISGDSHADYLPTLEAFAQSIGHPVEYVANGHAIGELGSCGPDWIKVAADCPANQRVRVLLHELAHALGVHYARFPGDDDPERFPRDVAEIMVESAAYVAASAVGLDTSGETIGYVAGWAKGSPARIEAVAHQVDALARKLEGALGLEKRASAQERSA
jgi:hypothetical protein